MDFGGRRGVRDGGPNFSASMAEWACARERPNPDNGGIRLPFTEDGVCSFIAPRTFSARKAVSSGDARDGALSDPKKIITKLHVNRGRPSAQEIKRVLVGSGGDNLHLLRHVDEVLERCDVSRSSDRAPHVPIAGTSAVSMSNEKLQVALLFLADIVALRVMDVFFK